jgi:hypothetical protein
MFVSVVDLRSCFTTFKEKKDLSEKILAVSPKMPQEGSACSGYPEIERALKTVLSYFLDHSCEHFDVVIPAALVNLVIMQAATIE